jgi:HlyD family secretion protein
MGRDGAVRIVLADDHPAIRTSLRFLLEADTRFRVVGDAENGLEAVALVEELEPDVVVLDVNMPVLDGINAARIISSKIRKPKIVILTMHDDPTIFLSAFNAGACSVLSKGCTPGKLLDAIWCNAGRHLAECAPALSA